MTGKKINCLAQKHVKHVVDLLVNHYCVVIRFKDDEDCVQQSKYKPHETVETETSKSDPYFQTSDTISDPLKNNLRNLLKSYPDGLWACVLPEKYEVSNNIDF